MSFLPGIDVLLSRNSAWLKGRRIAVVTHAAAVDIKGRSSAERLSAFPDGQTVCLMGPEHGFFGAAGAGALVVKARHPYLNIPVHSLYGKHRKPTRGMLKDVDAVVFDLQDMGARCYTYVSTLFYLLERAADLKLPVIVADRPVPLPLVVDGPCLDDKYRSFVGLVDVPLYYGMTPGETALYLKTRYALKLDLKIAKMKGYNRFSVPRAGLPPWIPPSPGITSWETACCYVATVFAEALPVVDNGRGGVLPFQLVGMPGVSGARLCDILNELRVPGACFVRHAYYPARAPYAGQLVDGVRLVVSAPALFRPVYAGVCIIWALQQIAGFEGVWKSSGIREDFFDKLYGCAYVREALKSGMNPSEIMLLWKKDVECFCKKRDKILLYEKQRGTI